MRICGQLCGQNASRLKPMTIRRPRAGSIYVVHVSRISTLIEGEDQAVKGSKITTLNQRKTSLTSGGRMASVLILYSAAQYDGLVVRFDSAKE